MDVQNPNAKLKIQFKALQEAAQIDPDKIKINGQASFSKV